MNIIHFFDTVSRFGTVSFHICALEYRDCTMELNYFRYLYTKRPGTMSLQKIVNISRSAPEIVSYTKQAREWYAKGKIGKGDVIKFTQLPAFAPGAVLDGGKSKNDVVDLTGICFIDIDHISEEQTKLTIQTLKDDPYTLFVAESVSGKGIHLLVRYTVDYGPSNMLFLSNPSRLRGLYKKVFLSLADLYTEKLGIQVDLSGVNAERLCIISYDPHLYYNPDSQKYIFDYESKLIKTPYGNNITEEP